MVKRSFLGVSTSRFILYAGVLVMLALVLRPLFVAATASWQAETVDSDGTVGLYPSLVLDAEGNPRMSYSYDTTKDLKYARWDGAQWQVETVESEGYVGSYSSLALDDAGNPHISYLYKSEDGH
jgi:hypothetical protein